MKCIYCNCETELTSSDIIPYAITGAKLAKSFVCKEHNAFTNNHFESKFIENLSFVRNRLGLMTRNKGAVRYTGDLTVDGETLYGFPISERRFLPLTKKVLAGKDSEGKRVLIGNTEKLKQIQKSRKGVFKSLKNRNAVVHGTIAAEYLLGTAAKHCIAKIAYEWHCYHHGIEEYIPEYKEIVDYILCDSDDDSLVELITNDSYYTAMDYAASPGTNSLYEYSEDRNLYVIFCLWNVISYRVRIKKSVSLIDCCSDLYLYNIDGTKEKKCFLLCDKVSGKVKCDTVSPDPTNKEIWSAFGIRFEKLLRTYLLSIHILNKNIVTIKSNLTKYEKKEICLDELLAYEEEVTVITILIMIKLYQNRSQYDYFRSFNDNLTNILKPSQGSMSMTKEDKETIVKQFEELNSRGILVPLMHDAISFFEKLYDIEKKKR